MSLPLPTILPSYNQIGFDSLHYLLGTRRPGGGTGVAWMIGGVVVPGQTIAAVDPSSQALLPLAVSWDGGFLTLANQASASIVVMNATIPFRSFRLAAALDSTGDAPFIQLTGSTICGQIPVYGSFLETLGLCNATTDEMIVSGGANFVAAPVDPSAIAAATGTVSWTFDATGVTATIVGGALSVKQHLVAILLVDDATGLPVPVDYGPLTTRTVDASGDVTAVQLPATSTPPTVRAYLMVDTIAAARATLSR